MKDVKISLQELIIAADEVRKQHVLDFSFVQKAEFDHIVACLIDLRESYSDTKVTGLPDYPSNTFGRA